MIKFEIAAKAATSQEALAKNIKAKKLDQYVEQNWQKNHELICKQYEVFLNRQ